MRTLPTLFLLSVFAAPHLARAADPGVSGSPPVALEPHGSNTRASATPPGADPVTRDSPPSPRTRWYGWQSLSADGAALLLLVAAGASSDRESPLPDALAYGALGSYLLGGPVSHFAHDNPGRGLGSLALRAGLPIAFGAIGANAENCSGGDFCGLGGAFLGGLLGIATAITVDAAVLSYDEAPAPSEGVQNVGVAIGHDSAVVVAGGTF